jgi:hypothetical protein
MPMCSFFVFPAAYRCLSRIMTTLTCPSPAVSEIATRDTGEDRRSHDRLRFMRNGENGLPFLSIHQPCFAIELLTVETLITYSINAKCHPHGPWNATGVMVLMCNVVQLQ